MWLLQRALHSITFDSIRSWSESNTPHKMQYVLKFVNQNVSKGIKPCGWLWVTSNEIQQYLKLQPTINQRRNPFSNPILHSPFKVHFQNHCALHNDSVCRFSFLISLRLFYHMCVTVVSLLAPFCLSYKDLFSRGSTRKLCSF